MRGINKRSSIQGDQSLMSWKPNAIGIVLGDNSKKGGILWLTYDATTNGNSLLKISYPK